MEETKSDFQQESNAAEKENSVDEEVKTDDKPANTSAEAEQKVEEPNKDNVNSESHEASVELLNKIRKQVEVCYI
jgi:hypothetical protein